MSRRPARHPEVAATLDALHGEIPGRLDAWDITGVLESIWDVVRDLNRLVERAKPWELAKDEGKAEELDTVLYDLADGIGHWRSRSTGICR